MTDLVWNQHPSWVLLLNHIGGYRGHHGLSLMLDQLHSFILWNFLVWMLKLLWKICFFGHLKKVHTYGSWDFFLCSPNCPKQPRNSFPFYKFFYPIVSAKVSGSNDFLSVWLCIINWVSKLASPFPPSFLIYWWWSRWCDNISVIWFLHFDLSEEFKAK